VRTIRGFVVGQILPRNSRDNINCGSDLDECNRTLEEYRNYKLSTEAYVGALEYQSGLLTKCMLLIE
jgi:hypothetical protein